jgi:hypothetical protein
MMGYGPSEAVLVEATLGKAEFNFRN